MATDVGKTIRKRRQVLGLTQAQLASRLGVSESTVANWEKGRHFPLRYEGRIEEVLDIDFSDDEPGLPPEVAEHWDDPSVRTVWNLSDDEMPAAVRLAWIRAWIHVRSAEASGPRRRTA